MSKLLVVLVLVVTTAFTAPAQAQSGRIVGRVVDAVTGEPVFGARIILFPGPGTVAPRGLIRATTNTRGIFDLASVPPGRWRVQADKIGYVTFGLVYTTEMTVDVSGATVTVPDVRLDPGGVITGHVLDAKGNGMVGAMVQVQPLIPGPDGTPRVLLYPMHADTNDRGEFRLAGLPPGQHIVFAQLSPLPMGSPQTRPPQAAFTYVTTYYPGFSDRARASPITVVRGATTNGIDFTLLSVATRRVSGVVVDSAGRPVAGALVRLAAKGSMSMGLLQSTPTTNDGAFRIVNVPDGTYVAMAGVTVVTRSGNRTSTTVDFPPGGARTGIEFVVQGNDVGGLQVVLQPRQ